MGTGLAAILLAVFSLLVPDHLVASQWPVMALAPCIALAAFLCAIALTFRRWPARWPVIVPAALAAGLAVSAVVATLGAGSQTPDLPWFYRTETGTPVSMATALAMVLLGSALALGADPQRWPRAMWAASALASVGVALGVIGLLRAVLGWNAPGIWQSYQGSGPLASALLLLVGLGLLAHGWEKPWHFRREFGFSLPVVAAGLTATFLLYSSFSEQDRTESQEFAQARALAGLDAINRRCDSTSNSLARIARLMSEQQSVEQQEWTSTVSSIASGMPGLVRCDIESRGVRCYSPLEGRFSAQAQAAWAAAFAPNSQGQHRPCATVRTGETTQLCFAAQHTGSGGHEISVIAVFEPQQYFAAALPARFEADYTCRLTDADGAALFASADLAGDAPWVNLSIGPSQAWNLELKPAPAFLQQRRSNAPAAVLVSGILCSSLLGFATQLALVSRRRTAQAGRASQALADSQEHLAKLVASLPEAILTVAPDGTIERVDGAALPVLTQREKPLVGSSVDEIIGLDPVGKELRTTRTQRGMDALVGKVVDAVVTGPNGLQTWCVIRISSFQTAAGRKYLWTVTDIEWRRSSESENQRLLRALQTSNQDLRAQADQARESAERFEVLVASAPDATLLVDQTGTIVEFNQRATALFGWSRQEAIGRQLEMLLPENLRQSHVPLRNAFIAQPDARAMAAGRELVGQAKDGSQVPVEVTLSPVRFDGQMHTVASIRDVSLRRGLQVEREKLIAELRRQSELNRELATRYRALYDCGAVGFGAVDAQGKFLECNEAYAKMVGYTTQEVLAMSIQDLNHPNDRSQAGNFIAEMQAGTRESYNVIKQYLRKDGNTVWVDVTGAALRDDEGKLQAIIGISLDITQRVEIAKSLQDSEQKLQKVNEQLEVGNRELKAILEQSREGEERFRMLLASAPEATILVDAEGRILEFNQRAQELLGYTEAEARSLTVEVLVPPEVRPRHEGIRKNFMAAPESRMMARGRDLVAMCKDGSRVPVEINLSPLRFRGQVMVAASLVDLRQRLRAADDLRASERRLREANKELESIVYVASHDMRSPLVNLQGFSSQLSASVRKLQPLLDRLPEGEQQQAKAVLGEEIPEAVGFIASSTRKMDGLIKGLLRMSRLGRAPLQLKQLDMNRLMAETVGSTQYVLNQQGVSMEVGDLPSCWGDETQIGQVFSNLLDNAVKYRDPTRPALISVRGEVSGEYAVYTVQDNGIGIAADHQKQVFEIFHRLAPDGAVPGEGLGLSVVKRIVDRHEGDIRLVSQPAVGSRFTVFLPRFAGARRPTEVSLDQPS